VLVFLTLAVSHALLFSPVLLASMGMLTFGPRWLGGLLYVAYFFPALLLAEVGVPRTRTGSPLLLPVGILVNSLLWSATVYGLFLAGRWARTRLTRRSGFG
jgi:hypothetical protein